MNVVRENSWVVTELNVTAGAPQSRYCLHACAKRISTGQWSCTAGEFDWTYDGDEIVSILEGSAYLTYEGRTRLVSAGDTVHFTPQTIVHWRIEEYVRKFWVIHSPTLLDRAMRFFGKTL